MAREIGIQELIQRATTVLPVSGEDLLLRGITAEAVERIFALKRAAAHLQAQYGSLEALEQRIREEGVPPDDHTLYTDLLEWRAIRHEGIESIRQLRSYPHHFQRRDEQGRWVFEESAMQGDVERDIEQVLEVLRAFLGL